MAGAKPTEEEKAQIKDLAQKGYKVEEIQQRFPHIDGRSVAGVHVRATAKNPTPEAQGSTLPPSAGGEAPGAAGPTRATPAADANKTPQQLAAENLGFTPVTGTTHNPGGFTPMYREYFIVKKTDPPHEGVQKTEYPPFGITELYSRYPTGEYEVHHYREGRLFNTYRDKIVKQTDPSASNPNSPTRESVIQRDPADLLMKGMDILDRVNTRSNEKVAAAESARVQAEVARETGKARVEETATVGLIKMLEKQSEPKPDTAGPAMDKILAMMQQEKTNAEARHRQELETLEKKQTAELEREKLRVAAESDRLKADLASREKMQQDFLAKMAEVERARNDLAKETQAKMIDDIKAVQDAYKTDFEDKKKFMDKQFDMQQKYVEEIIKIKKEAGTGADSLKMAEIIKDGVVSGLDRVGARIDMLVDKGVIPGKVGHTSTEVPKDEAVAKVEGKAAEAAKELATKDAIKGAVKEQWFQDLQDEIAVTIDRRKKAPQPALKPHGSMLGQGFIDKMNKEPRIRTYFHYLCTRYWNQVMEDAAEGIKTEHKELFADPEAESWFVEFQAFLTAAWNASIGVGRKP